ncbi:MAG: tetratricopeptide repeat protein [Candidatus Obscuribacter sp.]|nr:tetratricopeptide repeat protein [Candidatus Obscuribacter sp.]MBK9282011.1 tetratricopeptide repeat protein [Candidatus Obscuribacter sp.]MBL8082212.1 tetratricopeptide repeat protein [Candidatus Obscuribacter sp.]
MQTGDTAAEDGGGAGGTAGNLSSLSLIKDASSSCSYLIRGLYKVARGWQERGELNAARRIYKFILKIKERSQINCLEVVMSQANLALIYLKEEAYPEAEEFFKRALSACYELLGEESEVFNTLLNDYAALLRKMGLPEQAHYLEARNWSKPGGLPFLLSS